MSLESIQSIIAGYLGLQIAHAVLVLLMGRIVTDFFSLIVWEKPTNPVTRTITFISYFLFGAGPYLDWKFREYGFGFIKRKLCLLGCIVLMIIGSVLLYYGLMAIIEPLYHLIVS